MNMKKIHVLPSIIAVGSFIWGIMAIQRWWFVYRDISQLALALLIAIIGLGGAYVYNYLRNNDDDKEQIREHFNNRYDVLYDEIEEMKKNGK